MNQSAILFPVVALVAWTFAVLLLIPFHRVRAVMRRQVIADDFKFGESSSVPALVGLPNRNYMNLLEMPILFYGACLSLLQIGAVNAPALWLAWAYVALRIAHSLVHLTYNKVVHRLSLFALSNVVLLALWARIALALLDHGVSVAA